MAAVLAGLRVLELAGLAPAPFAGMILADFGATVTRVDKVKIYMTLDTLARGKRSIALDLQSPRGVDTLRRLCAKSDVLIEPFRPGVMEKLGLGPNVLMKDNPRLIYARLTGYCVEPTVPKRENPYALDTGYGQQGPMAPRAGHDINYIAMTGLLSQLGRKDSNFMPPLNLLGDFAGGGLMCVMGILLALLDRNKSGKGQVIDSAMIDGAAYIGYFVYKNFDKFWPRKHGENLLDTGAPFYDTYKTADDKYVAIGCIEGKFYRQLKKGLGLSEDISDQLDMDKWSAQKEQIAKIFASKTQKEWCDIFEGTDACFAPVLTVQEAPKHPHNRERKTFIENEGLHEPAPAPKLSRTPGNESPRQQPHIGEHTVKVLMESDFTESEIKELLKDGIVEAAQTKSSL